MQEKNKSVKTAVEAKPEESQVGQWDALARNMVRLFDEGTKVLGTLVERRNGSGPYSMAAEANEATKALGEVARQWVSEPGKLAAAQNELFKDYAELWGRSVRRFLGEEVEPVIEPAPGDNRFKDPDWSNSQFFDFWKQAYLLTARWAEDVTRNTEGVDDKTKKRALFYLEQMLAAFSPSTWSPAWRCRASTIPRWTVSPCARTKPTPPARRGSSWRANSSPAAAWTWSSGQGSAPASPPVRRCRGAPTPC